ncbi:unnamed protein product [Darwinula stevensoni]|uniref:Uncharacterized protein n=1 Tax=Darwinula stevensoni TaxID=69355 RepID=A0A7R8XBE4_9CRUS|nr:unnamed protein product [Darwinula stevensoni]CAG0884709.1 unnamed protein product [Darwinula stevensoni]
MEQGIGLVLLVLLEAFLVLGDPDADPEAKAVADPHASPDPVAQWYPSSSSSSSSSGGGGYGKKKKKKQKKKKKKKKKRPSSSSSSSSSSFGIGEAIALINGNENSGGIDRQPRLTLSGERYSLSAILTFYSLKELHSAIVMKLIGIGLVLLVLLEAFLVLGDPDADPEAKAVADPHASPDPVARGKSGPGQFKFEQE